jgi:hypothetical protein
MPQSGNMPLNFYSEKSPMDFWVWVDLSNAIVRHQISIRGSFMSAGGTCRGESNLPFLPNPKFAGDISPFTVGVTQQYSVEYNLEICREQSFSSYPSRLNSIYLLRTEMEALEYKQRHPTHVSNRVLRKVRTEGEYVYSTHDSSWVDFMRLKHGLDSQTIDQVAEAYWQGDNVKDHPLRSMGVPWTQSPIVEVLYSGQIVFYNRSLPPEQPS